MSINKIKLHSRISFWNEAQKFTALRFISKSHLCNIVQKEVELSEPTFKRNMNHFGKICRSFWIRYTRHQSISDVIHSIAGDSRNSC